MNAFAEIAVAIFSFLFEVTIYAVRFAIAPLRFLCSSRYRVATHKQWQGHPLRCSAELFGGTLALLLFAGAISWWFYVLTLPAPPPNLLERAELERYILEKLHQHRNRREEDKVD
jgi:hypothetical protein